MIDVKVNWKNIKKDRYRVKELLSYKRSISLVVGERRVGKTFEILLCLILDALRREELTFTWWRLTKLELDMCKAEFFSDMVAFNVFPEYSFKIVGNYGYATKVSDGYSFPICFLGYLKNHQAIKGTPFPKVRYNVVDEWFEESGKTKVRKKLTMLHSINYTIFELRPVRAIIIGNAVTIDDPLLKAYNITNIDRPFTKNSNIVVENTDKEERYLAFKKQAKESSFGKLVEGTEYGEYALNNKFLLDDYSRIDPTIKVSSEPIISISFEKHIIGVFSQNKMFYIKEIKQPSKQCITPFTSEVRKGIMYVRSSDAIYKKLFKMLLTLPYYYDSLYTQNMFLTLLNKSMGNMVNN